MGSQGSYILKQVESSEAGDRQELFVCAFAQEGTSVTSEKNKFTVHFARLIFNAQIRREKSILWSETSAFTAVWLCTYGVVAVALVHEQNQS